MNIPYAMFRAALHGGRLDRVIDLARQMEPMRLDDALRVVLLMQDAKDSRYEAACVRWVGRFALEGRGVTIDDLRQAAVVLGYLPETPNEAMEQLLALCVARGVGRPG